MRERALPVDGQALGALGASGEGLGTRSCQPQVLGDPTCLLGLGTLIEFVIRSRPAAAMPWHGSSS